MGDADLAKRLSGAINDIVGAQRDRKHVMSEVRTMRDLIAHEKGEADPWDLKLARGGLTDLNFIAQALTLAHGAKHTSLIGHPPEETFQEACKADLISDDDARDLIEAHRQFNAIFQWQRLTIEGAFDPARVSPAIFKRLATVAGLPDAKVLLTHMNETRQQVREIYDRVLR
jgi:glutamate-ammonia-ligase adenylyltransferase